jgi:hypothetical protein
MNDMERVAIERLAEILLDRDQETAVGASALAEKGYDTGLVLELVNAYARLPQAKRRFEFRTDESGRLGDFALRVTRR